MMPTKDHKVMQLPVSLITVEAPETKTFRLDLGSHKPFPFVPGQFIVITAELWNPRRGRAGPLNRAFSISSSPTEEDYVEITAKKYQDGRMTPWLHDAVQVGQVLDVKGPEGKFVFQEGESDELILIAGGIGIAPYRSIIRYILTQGLPVEIRLIYSARTPEDFAYKAEFDDLVTKHPTFRCIYTVTQEHQGWTGRIGRVDEALLREHLGSSKALYYLCGPDRMILEQAETLRRLGVADKAIRSERW